MSDIVRRPVVLLVEDYEDTREMYRDYLEFSGFTVSTASNGVEALAQAAALRPDVILMDLSLPVMDGWEAARRLKTAPETAALKIIALSAHASADAAGGRQHGCDAFIAKPCLPTDLVARLLTFLSLESTPSARVSPPRGPRA